MIVNTHAENLAAQQLCESQSSTAPGVPFSGHIHVVRPASDKPADHVAQSGRPTVIVAPSSSHQSTSDLHHHPRDVPDAFVAARPRVAGAMFPETDLLLKLLVLGREGGSPMKGVQAIARTLEMPDGILNPYIGNNGDLTEQGKAVIHSDAIIRWLQLTAEQRRSQDLGAFCDLYEIEPAEFLRSFTIAGQLTMAGEQVMKTAGYISRPVTDAGALAHAQIINCMPARCRKP